jgi:hypothetical protein
MVAKHGKDGYFQGAGSKNKWPAARAKYHWDTVAELAPKVAEKFCETPNWLRERLEIHGRKGNGTYQISDGIYDSVDAVLSEAVQAGMELNTSSVEEVLQDAIETYNKEVAAWREAREKADLAPLNQLCDSGASEEEMARMTEEQLRARESWPSQCDVGKTPRALNQLALDFCTKYGYANYRQDKPQKHLPRDHPAIQRVTQFLRMTMAEGQVNPKLVGHWDQVGVGETVDRIYYTHRLFRLLC